MKIRCLLLVLVILCSFFAIGIESGHSAQGPKGPKGQQNEILNEILEQLQASVQPEAVGDLVTLQATSQPVEPPDICNAATRYEFNRRQQSNGLVVNFTIPSDRVLIVTNLDWVVNNPDRPNSVRTARLLRVRGGGVNGSAALSSAMSDSAGVAGAYETFPTGLAVSSSAALSTHLCITMMNPGEREDVTATVQGYLFPSP